MSIRYRTTLFRPEGVGTWTLVPIPPEESTRHGLKMRVRVRGTIDGAPFESAILSRGGLDLFLVVASPIRDAIGKQAGDEVDVAFDVTAAPATVSVPADLATALRAAPKAKRGFEAMAPSHRKNFVLWIEAAKRPETRERRVAETVTRSAENRPLT